MLHFQSLCLMINFHIICPLRIGTSIDLLLVGDNRPSCRGVIRRRKRGLDCSEVEVTISYLKFILSNLNNVLCSLELTRMNLREKVSL